MRRPTRIATTAGLGLMLGITGMTASQEETPYVCNSVSTSNDPATAQVLPLLGVVNQREEFPVGINCTPAASNDEANFCGIGPDTYNGVAVIGGINIYRNNILDAF